jgi:hypothetical protein
MIIGIRKKFVFTIMVLFVFSNSLIFSESSQEESTDSDVLWTVVPGPFYNPNVGTGLLVMPMVVYPADSEDKVSPRPPQCWPCLLQSQTGPQKGQPLWVA